MRTGFCRLELTLQRENSIAKSVLQEKIQYAQLRHQAVAIIEQSLKE